MIERWPERWLEWQRGSGCPMCEEGRPERNQLGLRWFAGDCADAYLLRAPSTPGHTVVVWRGAHVSEPTHLDSKAAGHYWSELLRVAAVLEEVHRPRKLNLGINGNGVPHLHAHVVLRFSDDRAPGRPLPRGETANLAEEELAGQVASSRRRSETDRGRGGGCRAEEENGWRTATTVLPDESRQNPIRLFASWTASWAIGR